MGCCVQRTGLWLQVGSGEDSLGAQGFGGGRRVMKVSELEKLLQDSTVLGGLVKVRDGGLV
jgi:hypothetical protein